ncbi:MAG: phospholipase D-like domain-containing protein [Myxococcota bacterium]
MGSDRPQGGDGGSTDASDLRAWLASSLRDQRFSPAERDELEKRLDRAPDLPRRERRRVAIDVARASLGSQKQTRHTLDWLHDVLTVLEEHPARAVPSSTPQTCFSPGDGPVREIQERLHRAREAVDICVFTITDDRLAKSILACHRRGVPVRVISDDDKAHDRGSDIRRLRDAGVPVRVDQSEHHMHHKFALFDRRTLLTGSYNWTRSAARFNREHVVFLDDPGLVRTFGDHFEELWRAFA